MRANREQFAPHNGMRLTARGVASDAADFGRALRPREFKSFSKLLMAGRDSPP
jgi:hypothetical protein